MNRKFLTSALYILCTIQKLFPIWKFYVLTVDTKIITTNKSYFSDNLSPDQGSLFHLNDFLRQSVALSVEIVPLEYFLQTICRLIGAFVQHAWLSQKHCLRMWIHLIIFFPESVIIIATLLHLVTHSQTSCLSCLNFLSKNTFGFQDERLWFTARAVFLSWLVFLFMVFPYIVIWYWVTLATDFFPFFPLHCHSKVAALFTFVPHCFVKSLLLKFPR